MFHPRPLPESIQRLLVQLPISYFSTPGEGIEVEAEFSDDRANKKLPCEAEQLPEDAPTLIIVDTSSNVDVLPDWSRFVHRWFSGGVQDTKAPSKPSGVWFIGETITPGGTTRFQRPLLIENASAPTLPREIRDLIREVGSR